MKLFIRKSLLIFYLICVCKGDLTTKQSFIQTITTTVINTHVNSTAITFNSGTLTDKLADLQKKELACIYINGINKQSFIDCYGRQYSKLANDFLMIFKNIKDEFLRDFENSMTRVCPEYPQPCTEIIKYVSDNIITDPDITTELESFCDIRRDLLSVDSFLLDEAVQKFKTKYNLYMNFRNAIAKETISTQNKIANYIKSSKIREILDDEDFGVTEFMGKMGMIEKDKVQGFGAFETSDDDQVQMQSIFTVGHAAGADYESDPNLIKEKVDRLSRKIQGLTMKLSSKKQLKDRNFNGNNFLIKLIPEAQDQKLLQYYTATRAIDPNTLDLSQLPSQIIDQIKRNKIHLAGQQKK